VLALEKRPRHKGAPQTFAALKLPTRQADKPFRPWVKIGPTWGWKIEGLSLCHKAENVFQGRAGKFASHQKNIVGIRIIGSIAHCESQAIEIPLLV
jgi:hypothetical protein